MNHANFNCEYVWALDIETAGNEMAKDFNKEFAKPVKVPKYVDVATVKAPSSYKDEAKIADYIEKTTAKVTAKNLELKADYEAKIADGISGEKDALSWMTGKIVSIALVNVKDVGEGVKEPRTIAFVGADEKAILTKFANAMNDGKNGIFQVVGKTSATFDFPFIKGRLMVNNISIPTEMMNTFNLLDIDKMICSFGQTNQTASLAKYAFALGLGGKLMNGGDVPNLYRDAVSAKALGDKDKFKEIMLSIKAYNIQDSVITAAIAYRLIKQGK